MIADTGTPTEVPDLPCETITFPSVSPVLPAGGVNVDPGPDLSREGPFDACDADHDAGQSPVVMDSMAGCQYRMTSYEERINSSDMDRRMAYTCTTPVLLNTWGHRSLPVWWGGHQNIGYSTWVVSEQFRLHFVCIMMPVSSWLTFRSCRSWRLAFPERHRKWCGRYTTESRSQQNRWIWWRRVARSDGQRTIWQLWGCGDQRAPQYFRVQCRHRPVIRAWRVTIVSRTGESRTLMPSGYELYWCPWAMNYILKC